MEENFRSETPHGPKSDKSSLTAENCKDLLRCSDNCKVWTDEKHNSYLNLLESSFVTRLFHTKGFMEQVFEKNHGDINNSHKLSGGAHNSPEQFTVLRNGYWQKINYERSEPLFRAPADSNAPLKSSWISRLKRKGLDCHPPETDMQYILKFFSAQKEGIKSNAAATTSMQVSASYPDSALLDLTRVEGSGQNFLDEDSQSKSNIEPRAKRVKEAFANSSCQDQIVPTTALSGSHNSAAEELYQRGSFSE